MSTVTTLPPSVSVAAHPAADLMAAYQRVRAETEAFAARLRPEDMVIQSMPDVSPTKWHLAHTTWFFERFILAEFIRDYRFFHPRYEFLFNSYYNTIGPMHCRSNRGTLSRPDAAEVLQFRHAIDTQILNLLETQGDALPPDARQRLVIGLHHEQQHQELMVTDLKHVFSSNPLMPAYGESESIETSSDLRQTVPPLRWVEFDGGLVEAGLNATGRGHTYDTFAYDNESPRHKVYLQPFALADRPVTNGEFEAFIADGGYQRHDLWLAAGWAWAQENDLKLPLYWYQPDRTPDAGATVYHHYTLAGPAPAYAGEPVCHLSYFEADAYARWAGARLPSEFEWERAATDHSVQGHFADRQRYHPESVGSTNRTESPGLHQLFGDVWEWTRSDYGPYPGFATAPGALGEYNGKFMCNQYVLRGGSCATPAGHLRTTYRNFFPPDARWQFSGLRLARDA